MSMSSLPFCALNMNRILAQLEFWNFNTASFSFQYYFGLQFNINQFIVLPLFLKIKQTEQCYFICIKFKIHFLESSLQIYNFENEVQAITILSGKLIPV